jgi:Mn-dependent DtxR family transcriptional regulator
LVYTHEFLAAMMGANRKSVTLAANALQAAGLITYRRGKMQVLDRPGLEAAACECYRAIMQRFAEFLKPPAHAVQQHIAGRT